MNQRCVINSLFSVLLMVAFAFAATETQAAGSYRTGIQYTQNAYRMGPGDILSVQVYNQPEFSQSDISVREDGNASFNGIGELNVSGLTVEQVSALVTNRLGELVISPIVTISISQSKPATVYLSGAVRNPGMYQLATAAGKASTNGISQGITRVDPKLSNILANAGGLRLDANLSNVQIKRAVDGEIITVNLWNMLKQGDANQDIWLQSGDSVYVPASAANSRLADADYMTLLNSTIGPRFSRFA